ncbi:hypothetical protein V2J09_007075 [Rumex salicifolius]
MEEEKEASVTDWTSRFRASLNGIFVNGIKVNRGSFVELLVGDEVAIVDRIGFLVNSQNKFVPPPGKNFSLNLLGSSYPIAKFLAISRYPPFPEAIAFGKDSRKQGVACHHPKLLVLQREDTIRVIVSSANLNEKQVSYLV